MIEVSVRACMRACVCVCVYKVHKTKILFNLTDMSWIYCMHAYQQTCTAD